jgi:hypothetical protein
MVPRYELITLVDVTSAQYEPAVGQDVQDDPLLAGMHLDEEVA